MPAGKLTFRSLQARPVRVPLRRPVVSKVGHFDDWPLILIDLQTEEGIVGRSYLEPYLADAAGYLAPILRNLAEARAGKPIRPLDDFQVARKSLNLLGYEGLTMIAIAGIDMAAWDALSKAAGLPLATFLGASVGKVPAYNSNGLWLGKPAASMGQEAAELMAEGGFHALKLRLGRDRLDDDLAAIASIRAAVGEDVKLMVDFNQGLTRGDAVRRCHELDDQGLYWFEEPTTYDNLLAYAQLARELRTPLQVGENFYGPRDLARFVDAGAADFVMPDLMRIGGISGWMRSVPIAAAQGIPVSTHLYPEVAAHLMRATETAHWLEWQDWAYPILEEPFPLADGTLTVPNRPGCGIAWDEKAVARYAY